MLTQHGKLVLIAYVRTQKVHHDLVQFNYPGRKKQNGEHFSLNHWQIKFPLMVFSKWYINSKKSLLMEEESGPRRHVNMQ